MKIEPGRFGGELRKIRETVGMSQAKLAKKSSLSVNYISLLENGDRTPSIEAVNSVAAALDIPAQCLIFLGGERPNGKFKSLVEDVSAAIHETLSAQHS